MGFYRIYMGFDVIKIVNEWHAMGFEAIQKDFFMVP